MKHFFTLIAAAMTFMVSGWSQTVVDIVVDSEDHTVLEAAVVEAGLVETLQGEGPFTVFAPTDAAFTALLTALGVEAADLLGLPQLGDILTYHVAGVEAMSTDLSDGQMVTTVNGQDVTISIMGDTVMINGSATVTVANIDATNGVVHVIDAVLVPAIITGCTDMMACNYSLVANTDDQSCVLPGDMCDDGDDATVNDMVGDDCMCAGIPATVVDIVVNSEDHTLLEAAVGAANLVDALSAEGPFTVFAPTDAAIAALVEALEITAEDLLALPDLGEILQYHVVAGAAMSGDLSDGQEIETLLGENVTVTIDMDMNVFINNAQVTVADIEAGNGVVHVIDAVLLPPAPVTNTVVDVIVNSEDHTLLEAAVIEAGLVEALSAEGPFTVFAPTDAAITALIEALEITAEDLLALPNLGDILQYHVVAGAAMSGDLTDGQEIETLLGSNVTVTINTEGVFINDAQVTVADIEADNGVVHVIDAVLLPPTPDNIHEATATWSVMPNPAKDVVILTGVNPSATLALLDMTGRTVREFAQGTTVLTVGDLTPGTYMLTVNDGRNLELKKIMVQ
ncbi:MAG: fasciclin domain-containing protein [Bacteroidota bacterium]|nr:fasciclin domain-containing protein [Bacteroidota bacterium]